MVLYPLLWTVLTSLKSKKQFNLGQPWDLPEWPFQFVNYTEAWTNSHFGEFFLNSLIVVSGAVVISLLLSSTSAFMIARHPFFGSKTLASVYVFSMMFPYVMGLIPLFFLMSSLHLQDSLLGLILVYATMQIPFGIYVLRGFFKSIPMEMEEAAIIDGCNTFGVFFKILLPLAKAGLITVGITNMLAFWNEYMLSLVLINSPKKYTVSLGLTFMQAAMQYSVDWGVLFAGLVISVIPVFVAYIAFQRFIAEGITAGAVKG